MVRNFPIIQVPPDACLANEDLGTKPKFWFEHREFGRCLYKQARANTGEDWAEKIASEFCQLLGLPHATVELATWKTSLGTVSPSFMPKNGQIIHGNEILFKNDGKYPRSRQYAVSEHTLDAVLIAISDEAVKLPLNWTPPPGIQTAADTFIGYLMLDAWIGNTDRHHENWGFIEISEAGLLTVHLAPTYDHASSMGRELQDSQRQNIVSSKSVNQYVAKCRSALYDTALCVTNWYSNSSEQSNLTDHVCHITLLPMLAVSLSG
ncbi:MAG: hypothetical protein Fur0025_29050 [Oscillatoriaceae cyanobacterium]